MRVGGLFSLIDICGCETGEVCTRLLVTEAHREPAPLFIKRGDSILRDTARFPSAQSSGLLLRRFFERPRLPRCLDGRMSPTTATAGVGARAGKPDPLQG